MLKLAANLSMLYGEHEFTQRFAAAAADGFRGVEYLFPYDHPPEVLAGLLQRSRLQQVLFDFPAGDWQAGERGIAALPERAAEFQDGVGTAIRYAKALDCKLLTVLAGRLAPAHDPEACRDTLVSNLRHAAAEAAAIGATVLLEPLNAIDAPGYLVSSSAKAIEIIRAADRPNIRLQYDIYHLQRQEGNLADTIARHIADIAHFQLADSPGRHEPGTGEINFGFLLDFIERQGYAGWAGLEYAPSGSAHLEWARSRLSR